MFRNKIEEKTQWKITKCLAHIYYVTIKLNENHEIEGELETNEKTTKKNYIILLS